MKTIIDYTTEIWKEGDAYVAWSPELDVSSAGKTVDEARAHLREAVELFLEESERMGTLGEVMEEAGYAPSVKGWRAPERIAIEHAQLALP